MTPILALDIDGVLNSGKYLKECNLDDEEGCILDPERLKYIKTILESNKDINIIMNSSWNSVFNLDDYKSLFSKYLSDFPVDRIVDVTSSSCDKTTSLVLWLKSNHPSNFLVIDDDCLFDLSHPYYDHQLKTSYYIGLTKNHIDVIIEVLENKFSVMTKSNES